MKYKTYCESMYEISAKNIAAMILRTYKGKTVTNSGPEYVSKVSKSEMKKLNTSMEQSMWKKSAGSVPGEIEWKHWGDDIFVRVNTKTGEIRIPKD